RNVQEARRLWRGGGSALCRRQASQPAEQRICRTRGTDRDKPLAGAGGGVVGGDRAAHVPVFMAAGAGGEMPDFPAEADRTWGRCSLKKYTGPCARARRPSNARSILIAPRRRSMWMPKGGDGKAGASRSWNPARTEPSITGRATRFSLCSATRLR